MCKIMIVSDIHGSSFYCKKMLEQFDKENAENLLILGDILYHGPRNDLPKEYNPKKVINLLNNLKDKIYCIRGNCDTEVDQMVLDFPILAEYCILALGKRIIYATHGHNYNLDNMPPISKGDILLHGHTHIPAWENFGNDNLYLNPGSISIPKNGSKHSYMIYEDNIFTWKDLDGNIYKTLKI